MMISRRHLAPSTGLVALIATLHFEEKWLNRVEAASATSDARLKPMWLADDDVSAIAVMEDYDNDKRGRDKYKVVLESGRVYRGRLFVPEQARVRVTTLPRDGPRATIEHKVEQPYESAIQCSGVLEMERVRVAHASPSVANNYAIAVERNAELRLIDCSVSSQTGSGVCVNGGRAQLISSNVSDTKEHGVAVYSDIETGQPGDATLIDCTIADTGGYAILARGEGVTVSVSVDTSLGDVRGDGKVGRRRGKRDSISALLGAEIIEEVRSRTL